MNTKKVMSAVTAAVLALQLTANSINLVNAQDAGSDNGYSCDPVAESPIHDKTENAVNGNYDTITVEDGYVITAVYVKAGAEDIGYGKGCSAPYTADGSSVEDYIVSGIGTSTVVVIRPEGSDAKEISHIEVVLAEVEDDDTTDPGDEDDDTATDDDAEEDIVEDDDTATDDDTTTDDDTEEDVVEDDDTTTGDDTEEEVVENTEANEGEVLGVDTESAKQGEVAGADQLADTGVSLAILSQIGQAIAVAVLARNAVKKDKRQ